MVQHTSEDEKELLHAMQADTIAADIQTLLVENQSENTNTSKQTSRIVKLSANQDGAVAVHPNKK